jgi:hypothetical protein
VRSCGLHRKRQISLANHILSCWAGKAPRGYGNAPIGLGSLPAVEGRGAILMGELVNLDEYRLRQKEIAEEKERAREQEELDQTIEEMEMLKSILENIMKDLPKVETSIMYIPIEPKMDAFLSKNVDSYLDHFNVELPPIDDYETDET